MLGGLNPTSKVEMPLPPITVSEPSNRVRCCSRNLEVKTDRLDRGTSILKPAV